jgi:outer membrane protein W
MQFRFVLIVMFAMAGSVWAESDTNAASAAPASTNVAVEAPAVATNQPAAVEAPAPAESVPEATAIETASKPWGFGEFSVGTRLTYVSLKQANKDFFLGHLNHMEVDQDLAPYKVFADWFFLPYLGVELTWDKMRAKVFNEPDPDGTRTSDGAWVISGPIATVVARYPNDSKFTPAVGVGAAFMSETFEHAGWWHWGYSSVQQYEAAGSPAAPYKGGTRTLDPKDSVGFVVTADCDYRFNDHWAADVYGRYMSISADTHWTNRGEDKGNTSVPLDNYVLGLGVKYVF